MTSKTIEYINLDDLSLDLENPRLPASFEKGNRDSKSIINWLLEDASIIELMTAIGQNGFFVGEALLVVNKNDEGLHVVVEGNRRLASLILLRNPDFASIHKRKIQQVLDKTKERPYEIPCIVFDSRDEILTYLGYRHVTGIKSWSLVSKARYLTKLRDKLGELPLSEQAKYLAKQIGSRSDYVKKLLISYLVYEEIEDNGFYGIPGLDDTTFYFNYISDSLSRENIRNFIGVDHNSEDPLKDLSKDSLGELIHWFFKKNENDKSRVLGNSSDLKKLDNVLSSDESLEYFRKTGDLSAAEIYVNQTSDSYSEELYKALRILKFSNSIIHNVENFNATDLDVLKEINNICKTMRDVILGRADDWD